MEQGTTMSIQGTFQVFKLPGRRGLLWVSHPAWLIVDRSVRWAGTAFGRAQGRLRRKTLRWFSGWSLPTAALPEVSLHRRSAVRFQPPMEAMERRLSFGSPGSNTSLVRHLPCRGIPILNTMEYPAFRSALLSLFGVQGQLTSTVPVRMGGWMLLT